MNDCSRLVSRSVDTDGSPALLLDRSIYPPTLHIQMKTVENCREVGQGVAHYTICEHGVWRQEGQGCEVSDPIITIV